MQRYRSGHNGADSKSCIIFKKLNKFIVWSGIEVVVTSLTRNQVVRKGTWVRIPPSPPNQTPSIDKRNFVSRWFFVCPKVLALSRFRALCFSPCSNSWCFSISVFGGYLTQTCSCQVLTFNDLTSWGVHLLTICLVIVKRYCYGKKTARRLASRIPWRP